MKLIEKFPIAYEGLLSRPIAILGAEGSGQALARLLAKAEIAYILYDEKADSGGTIRRDFGDAEARGHGLVLHGASIDKEHPWYKIASGAGCEVVSELEFSSRFRDGPFIAVTGTNGKTTLAEFITYSFKRAGRAALSINPLQYPLAQLAIHPDQDGVVAVCEISNDYGAFLTHLPAEVIFWTNYHEDHFETEKERRDNFLSYCSLLNLNEKARIYVGMSVKETADFYGIELPERTVICPRREYLDWDLPRESAFATAIHWNALCLFEHYWKDEGLPESQLKTAAQGFDVRAHRLHRCAVVGQLIYWNDSKSANFAAVEAALSNFTEPVVWIGGGRYRGGDLQSFFERIQSKVKQAIFIGEDAGKLAKAWNEKRPNCILAKSIKEAVESSYKTTEGKGNVVFSPGFAGGRILGDFQESGIYFENAVSGLKHRPSNI